MRKRRDMGLRDMQLGRGYSMLCNKSLLILRKHLMTEGAARVCGSLLLSDRNFWLSSRHLITGIFLQQLHKLNY